MRTFRDHGPRFGWFAYCQRCFHQRTLTLEHIERHIGLDADVVDVRRRLRCAALSSLHWRHGQGRTQPLRTPRPCGSAGKLTIGP